MSELTTPANVLPAALVDSVAKIKSFLIDSKEGALHLNKLPVGEQYKEFVDQVLSLWMPVYREFERQAAKLPAHPLSESKQYVREELHPHLLGAPFVARAFKKPRGYAGDYEMMNMLLRPGPLGDTVYDQLVHLMNVLPGIPDAVRNRNDIMRDYLRVYHSDFAPQGVFRVLSLACGPAWEIERFLRNAPTGKIEITLIDHDEEALTYAANRLKNVARELKLDIELTLIRESVFKLLKEGRQGIFRFKERHFHVAYSAGIMDYLSDNICTDLIAYLLRSINRHGVFFTTNMHPDNGEKYWMEYIFDWSLIYRDMEALEALSPVSANRVFADDTGINVFLEVKPS